MSTDKKASKHGVRRVIAALDHFATLFQNYHEALGVDQRLAMDFALRCDMLSDALPKPFGPKLASFFDPSTIAEEVPGPLLNDPTQPFMAGHFTQERFNALSAKQEAGDLARGAVSHKADPKLAALKAANAVLQSASENFRLALSVYAGEDAEGEKQDDAEKKAGEDEAKDEPKADDKKAGADAEDDKKDAPADDKKAGEDEKKDEDPDADAKKTAALFGLFADK